MTLKEYALAHGATEREINNGCPDLVIKDFEKLFRANPEIVVGCMKTKSCAKCWENQVEPTKEEKPDFKLGDIVWAMGLDSYAVVVSIGGNTCVIFTEDGKHIVIEKRMLRAAGSLKGLNRMAGGKNK